MEPLTILAAMVGFIGCFHILDSTVKVLAKGRNATATRRRKTDNWYCFFKLPALYGRGWKPVEERHREAADSLARKAERHRSGSRPRLHV